MTRRHAFLAAVVLLAASAATAQEKAEGGDPRGVVGPPKGQALAGEALLTRTEDVAGLLRCPVCQGLSVADSPSTTAQNMRHQVRELLERGYDQQQILAYFERSYGEFVRLQPPLRGVNWLLWLAPALVLLGGAFFLLRRRTPPAPEAPASDPTLDAYRARARALAFGDESSGGEPR